MADARQDLISDDEGILLDVLGILDGVDKASLRGDVNCAWDYLRHYGHAFRQFRNQAINVLELGVFGGASLNLWLRYFASATIIGVDINAACAALSRGRVQIRIGSQDDKSLLTEITKEFPPTIVIDDGSHIALQMIRSFEILFPLMLPGGIYVIEDLAFHFAAKGGDVLPIQPLTYVSCEPVYPYFARLIAAKTAHVSRLSDATEEMNELYKSIDVISVVGGALLIATKAPRNLDKYVAVFERELGLRTANGINQYMYIAAKYAEFLVTYRCNLKRAIQLLNELIGMDPNNRLVRKLLYQGLISSGKAEEAAKVKADLAAMNDDVALPETLVLEQMQYPH